MKAINILGINGSVRKHSSSHAVMEEITRSFPPRVNFTLFERLADIPAFDGSERDPEPVAFFKAQIKKANAVVICTPEYAFGVPGALKNAIDWTVGSGEFVNKPVALITASSQGRYGHEALQLILKAISAKLDPTTTLLISFIRNKVNGGMIVDETTADLVRKLSAHLIANIEN